MNTHYLDRLFSPRGIAVFGASEEQNAVGRRVFENLLNGDFRGPVYAINPKHKKVLSQPCFERIEDAPKAIDLAVIATPAETVPDIIRQCGEHGVSAAIIISAGFSEGQGQGSGLEKTVVQMAKRYQMQLLGPNCLGLIRPSIGMNATFSKNTALPGQLALISQSGALCTAILDWACANDVGFSTIVSLGNAADIDFGDLLDYLAQDPKTQSILLYVEGIRDARSFMSGLRIASRMKPVVVIKAGRHQAASQAAMTHTGAMIGGDDVFNAALKRAGVVRADSIQQLFAAAEILSTQSRVNGRRLAIVTNGGGLGVMATDRAVDLNIELAELSAETLAALDKSLPPHWSQRNPVDILGDASPERYQHAVKACLADDNVDGVLAMLSPQAMTDPDACAEAVIEAQQNQSKPVLACWMGQNLIAEADKRFAKHHLPCFSNPESSVEAFACLSRFHDNQQLLMQVPGPLASLSAPDVEGAKLIIDSVLAEGRQTLSTTESRALLKAFNIPVSFSINCENANAALVAAETLGYPVVMKISSPSIVHKTEVGGVRLNINNAQAVRTTYNELLEQVHVHQGNPYATHVTVEPMYVTPSGRELLVGASRDPVFGTAIVFGAGGIKVEVLQDRAIALPPLNQFLAERLIAETRISGLLGEFRGLPPINRQSLIQVLLRVSEMVCELPELLSLDINPLIADEKGVMALDARIEVGHQPAGINRYDHLAIHPYPNQLISLDQLPDGSNITIRPIRPEDAMIEQAFFRKLSAESRYFRFMQRLNELTQDMLIRFTQLDYSRELALIAVTDIDDEEVEVGVARYTMNPDGKSCEFALVVADEWQHRGIGSRLMKALIASARQQGFEQINGEILSSNINMQRLAEELGFRLSNDPDDPGVKLASKNLLS
ncbi:MAG: bifunctional acetate--CoA ligase family protein/GNAT family N-acetyltransferase [Methylophaga sp.]|nr:bifunctional acetate--CoA ligase family protein/GNAT family N-acetyltransferase [Methylophaga sp.]